MIIDTITLYVLVHAIDVILFLCLELSKDKYYDQGCHIYANLVFSDTHHKVWIVKKCADGLQNLHNKAKELTPLTQ